jgi:hypothetical protein
MVRQVGDSALMGVDSVALDVLAPRDFYAGYEFAWLERGIDEAVKSFSTERTAGAISMSFHFWAFAEEFQLPIAYGDDVLRLSAIYQVAIRGLSGLSHAAFASSSKLFGQRHCVGKLIDRRMCGMGCEQLELGPG